MSHLSEDRLADFLFEEMPPLEMEAVRGHLADCRECLERVSAFDKVRASLETLPAADAPRRMVFLESRPAPRATWKRLQWAIPAVAAIILAGALLLAGVEFGWRDGAMRIVVRPPVPAVEERMDVAAGPLGPAEELPAFDEAAFDAMTERLRRVEEERLRAVFEEHRAAMELRIQAISEMNARDLQRIQAELAYLADLQRAAWRDTLENASSIQLLAQRTEVRE